ATRRRHPSRDAGRTTGSGRMPAARARGRARTARATASGSCGPQARSRVAITLLGRPRLQAEAPQSHEPGRVVVTKCVGRVVGRQAVVVQAVVAATTGDLTRAGLEMKAHLAGHDALRVVDERVERLAQRREPEPVVHQLGVADLEPLLLAGQIAL